MSLSEPYPQTPATTAGQHADRKAAAASASAFLDSVEEIMQRANNSIAAEQTPRTPTFYKDPAPTPRIGDAPPVQQPGRAAMSQKATDDSVRLLSFGGTFLLVSGGIGIVMVASDYADPTVLGISGGVLAAVLLAAARLLRRGKEVVEAAPPQITQYYSGDIDQKNITVNNNGNSYGLVARNDHDQDF